MRKGAYDVTVREIPITVKAEFVDAQAVDRDAYDLALHATDEIRGHITSPRRASSVRRSPGTPARTSITPTGEVTRPAFGRPGVSGTLTATIAKGDASQTKMFPFTIEALPREEEKERYFLGYFKGEGIADGEQIMFATSNGNTALDWTGLTGGRPSLISQLGDQGLRDPHIVRSPDGDSFYMIATDLNWYDQGGYAINDTQYIEVFESHDLVNWTPQRHVQVAPDDAGNAFAPESLWVDEIGAYAVFWAQSLWNDPVNRTGQGNAQMWYNVDARLPDVLRAAGMAEPRSAVAHRHDRDQGGRHLLPGHEERGRERRARTSSPRSTPTSSTATSPPGRRWHPRSAGRPGRATPATRDR